MKRFLSLLLCISLLLPTIGCTEEASENPVNFYYRRSTITYDGSDGVIAFEQRESAGHENDLEYLLTEYLHGPVSGELTSAIPEGVTVVSVFCTEDTAKVTFNRRFASLTGLDLTLACACVTMTVIAITGVQTVQIRAAGALLDDYQSITMDKNCLLLLDSSISES